MRLKKWTAVICIGMISALLLSGCQLNEPLPDGMDEQALIAAATEVRELIFAGKYEEVTNRFRPDVREDNGITVDKVKSLVEVYANPKEIGTLKKVNKTTVAGNNEGEDHGIVVFECEFTEKKVGVGISFDMDMNLLGITLGS